MLEHEAAHLLAMYAHSLDSGRAGTNEIAHRLVCLVRHPYRGEFAGSQEFGERHRIAAVRLHPVARLPWDQRGCRDRAGIAERGDEAIEAIAGRAGFVAEMHPLVLGSEPLDQAAHALLGRVHLAEITDLAATLTIGDSDGVARLGDINPDENFCRMTHGSPSCDEDRLVRATSIPRRTYGLTLELRVPGADSAEGPVTVGRLAELGSWARSTPHRIIFEQKRCIPVA